jgi:hypothetical protein
MQDMHLSPRPSIKICKMYRFVFFAIFGWVAQVNALSDTSEELSLRRIADFWEEGEYQIAKQEMEHFLAHFPSSDYASTIYAALGDLMLREKSYEKALLYYTQIKDEKTSRQVFLNRMQALFHMGWYATLADECDSFLSQNKELPEDSDLLLHARYLLVTSIYQQCLNSSANPELLESLAHRAEPHFESLAKTNLSEDVSQAYAYMCTLLKNFKKAAQIYLDLSNQGGENQEKLLFQAALLQSKYDTKAALETFALLSKKGSPYAKEAAYNWLLLQFELGQFETLVSVKEETLLSIPEEKVPQAQLIFGKSFLALHQYKKAADELLSFLEKSKSEESIRPAILDLAEAAHQQRDVKLLDIALLRLRQLDPKDPYLLQMAHSKIHLLKKAQDFLSAKAELASLQSIGPLTARLELELIEIEFLTEQWESCHEKARLFLRSYPDDALSPHAWQFFIGASFKLDSKEMLLSDLTEALEKATFLTPSARLDWEFFLAKTHFELNQFSQAEQILGKIEEAHTPFQNQANADLLLAFCLRDSHGDLKGYCRLGEKALLGIATLIPPQEQRISLFNAYLALSTQEPQYLSVAAEHLYEVFLQKASLQEQNLLWLAEILCVQAETLPEKKEPALRVLSEVLNNKPCETKTEKLFLKLAKLYQSLGDVSQQIAILEKMKLGYEKELEQSWAYQNEALFLLGDANYKKGMLSRAEELFDQVANLSPGKRNFFSAQTTLQGALLKIRKKALLPAVTALKNLALQKRLENEPVHLEAALVYIDLVSGKAKIPRQWLKKKALLKKTKNAFETEDDLLSKDYHAAKTHFKEQAQIHSLYMQFFDAELLLTEAHLSTDVVQQKELQAKAKQILLQIASEHPPDALLRRVEDRMIEFK